MPAVADLDLEATIAAELAVHRLELEQLVRERVRFALAELTRELVAAELNGRSNGSAPQVDEEKPCSACGKTLPLASFTRDSRKRDGLRSRCRSGEAERVRELRQRHRAEPEEAEPVPLAGTQSTTSHENTLVST